MCTLYQVHHSWRKKKKDNYLLRKLVTFKLIKIPPKLATKCVPLITGTAFVERKTITIRPTMILNRIPQAMPPNVYRRFLSIYR